MQNYSLSIFYGKNMAIRIDCFRPHLNFKDKNMRQTLTENSIKILCDMKKICKVVFLNRHL